MQITKPFITLATVVVIVGLCIGVGLAFLLTCTGENCLLQREVSRVPNSFEECAAAGHPIMESYPRQCKVPGGGTFTEQTSSSSSSEDSSVNVIVTAPLEGDFVGYTFVATGIARVFENVVSWRLKDADGTLLVEGHVMANSPDIGQFGPFLIPIDATTAKGKTGTLEVYQASAKDGSDIDKVTIHVVFAR